MKKKSNLALPLGILAGLAATFLTGGAAAPALAAEAGGEAAAGAAGAGAAGALGGEAAAGAAGAAGAGIGGGTAANAFGALAGGAAPASTLATSLAGGAAATPSITGALAASAAPGAAAAGGAAGAAGSGVYLNPSDLAFQGSKLYNPATVGQTVPGAFPGSQFGDMAPVGAQAGKGPMDYLKMMQQVKGLAPKPAAQPQMRLPAPHAMGQQQQQSNEDIYRKYLQLSDPQTYQLLYGGGQGSLPGVGGYM